MQHNQVKMNGFLYVKNQISRLKSKLDGNIEIVASDLKEVDLF